jgi:hypothetical protein
MFNLQPPRHTSTLHNPAVLADGHPVRLRGQCGPFPSVLGVSAVPSPDFEIEHACEGDPGGKRSHGDELPKSFFTNPSTAATDIPEFARSHHDFLGSSKRHRNKI